MRNAVLLGCTSLLVACSPGGARESGDGSPIVARVAGQPVTRAELEAMAPAARGSSARIDWDAALRAFAEARVVDSELESRGLDRSPGYQAALASIRARALRAERELARDTLLASLEDGVELSDEELRQRYETLAERFQTTRLHLRQIRVPDRATLLAIRKRLEEGVAFEELAAQANVDPRLRARAGDLGWLDQRRLPAALIGPAHRLVREGEVSEPFRDREGSWNLVQLVGRETAVRELEEVRDEVRRELLATRSRERLAEILDAGVREQDPTLDREALAAEGY